MKRYILRYSGNGQKPAEDVQRVKELPGVRVVDETARMLLVDSPPASITTLARNLPNWCLSNETITPVPDSRPKIKKLVVS